MYAQSRLLKKIIIENPRLHRVHFFKKKAQRGGLQLDVLARASRHHGGPEGKLLLGRPLGELLSPAGLRLKGGRALHRRGTKNRDFSSVLGQKKLATFFGKFVAGGAQLPALRSGVGAGGVRGPGLNRDGRKQHG